METVILAQLTMMDTPVCDPKFCSNVVEAEEYCDEQERQWDLDHPGGPFNGPRPCHTFKELSVADALNLIMSRSK